MDKEIKGIRLKMCGLQIVLCGVGLQAVLQCHS